MWIQLSNVILLKLFQPRHVTNLIHVYLTINFIGDTVLLRYMYCGTLYQVLPSDMAHIIFVNYLRTYTCIILVHHMYRIKPIPAQNVIILSINYKLFETLSCPVPDTLVALPHTCATLTEQSINKHIFFAYPDNNFDHKTNSW